MDTEYLTVEHLSTKELTRIFSKVRIDPAITWSGAPCWVSFLFHGYGGYVQIKWHGRKELLHRLIYAWVYGPIPKGKKLTIDHLCRNTSCCNPVHLELVPARTNVLRGNGPVPENAKKTHCKRGHAFAGNNVRLDTSHSHPWRRCKICDSLKSTRFYYKAKGREIPARFL